MRKIPEFLKPKEDNYDSKTGEMMQLIEQYTLAFGKEPTTEPSVYDTDGWIIILNKCIKEHIPVTELLHEELEDEDIEEYNCILIEESEK